MTSANFPRRTFLGTLVGGSALAAAESLAAPTRFLKPISVDNPLASYPARGWEDSYRKIFQTDSSQ
jgi:hypothetical protein